MYKANSKISALLVVILAASNNAVAVNYVYTGNWDSGTPTTILSGDTLLISSAGGSFTSLTNQSNSSGGSFTGVSLAGSSTWSGSINNQAGASMRAQAPATIAGSFINAGDMFIIPGGSINAAGGILNSGILTMQGNNSFGSSELTMAGGSLRGFITPTVIGNNYTLTAPSTMDGISGFTINGLGNLNANTLTVNNDFSTTITLSGIISGNGGSITKSNSGELTLGNANTYTGVTRINAGRINVSADNNLGSPPVGVVAAQLTFGGGMLVTTNSFTINSNRGITLNAGGGTVSVGSGLTTTYNGVITGSNQFTKIGAGSLVLGGANTYTGVTTINAGTFRAGIVGAFSDSSPVVLGNFAGATLDLNSFNQSLVSISGGGATGGNITLGTATLTVNQISDTSYSGIISGAGGSITKSGAGTLTLSNANTYTGVTTINAGTLSIAADNNLGAAPGGVVAAKLTFGGGTLATTSSFTLDVNRGITLNAGAVIQPATSTTLTYNGIIAGANALTKSGAGTLVLGGTNTYTGGTTITAGTLQAGGASMPSGRAVTVGASGTLNLTAGSAATLGTVTNSGAMTIAANILMPGLTLTNNGNITVSGARTLDAAAFTSPGTQNYTITDIGTNDKFITNSAVDLTNGTVNVTSEFTGSSASWDILQGTSITTSNTTIKPPTNNAFGMWSSLIENNTLKILFTRQNAFTPSPGVNSEIAAVLNAMSNLSVKNAGQSALLGAVNSVTTQDQYNAALTALQPNTSSNPASIAMQCVMLNRIETRLANYDSTSSKLAANNQQVAIYTSGDTASDNAMWFSGFGVVAKQNAHDDFQGYRSNIYGFMLGAETKNEFDTIYGLALGVSNADVTATIDTSSATRVQGINLLAYGAAETKTNEFMEWMLGASVNRSKGNRDFSISGANLNTSAKYTGVVSGAKVNVGKSFTMTRNRRLFLVPVVSLQYMLAHQGEYQETGSVAALNINGNKNLNLLTVGAGLRLSKKYKNYWHWLDGSRALSAMVTYDAVSPQQISTASFVVGSGNFSMVNSPVRLALNLGADYSLSIRKNSYLQLSYNLQLRSGYYENFLEAKFRYLL